MWQRWCFMLSGVMLSIMVGWRPAGAAPPGYDYYLTGDPADVTPLTTPGFMLQGGGTDVDAAFEWLIEKSGGGDIIVIRTSGEDGYNDYIDSLGEVDSVETYVFHWRAAADSETIYTKLMTADALFIAGGDQYDYIRRWKGTRLEDALHDLAAQGVPIGGTSAGLAILGEVAFSAERGTVYSDEALANPYNRYMTLEADFLSFPQLANLITDSHFAERDRMGRLVAFVARMMQDGLVTQARGVGIDEQTAVLLEGDGSAQVVGVGAAYFLTAPGLPERCVPRRALIYLDVPVYRLRASDGGSFDFTTWQGNGGLAYTISAQAGDLSASKPGGPY